MMDMAIRKHVVDIKNGVELFWKQIVRIQPKKGMRRMVKDGRIGQMERIKGAA